MSLATMGVGYEPTPFPFQLVTKHRPEYLLENVRHALSLGLPELKVHVPNDGILAIAGGGPSLEDTWPELTGCIAAANGSLAYLHSKGVKPHLCGVVDPAEHMVGMVEANPEVTYFIASCVHRSIFDKLLAAKCNVVLWHHGPIDGLRHILPLGSPIVSGGSTMGLDWVVLGYQLGFRKFHLHGFDSSFRGKSSHAYPDHQDAKEWIVFDGYQTRLNFLGQIGDFLDLMEDGRFPDVEPTEVTMFGDGLLQSRYVHWQEKNPPFIWPQADIQGQKYIMQESRSIPEFLQFIPNRRTCIQAGGNVGVYPRKLAQHFCEVITLEPDRDNFACLIKNTAKYQNIKAMRAALGEFKDHAATESHEKGNSGAVRLIAGKETLVLPIDGIEVQDCDLIWLDVEGYEELALKGAARTIEKYHPAIIIEEKSILAEMHGLEPFGAMKWLKERQYRRVIKHGNDCLYVYGGA